MKLVCGYVFWWSYVYNDCHTNVVCLLCCKTKAIKWLFWGLSVCLCLLCYWSSVLSSLLGIGETFLRVQTKLHSYTGNYGSLAFYRDLDYVVVIRGAWKSLYLFMFPLNTLDSVWGHIISVGSCKSLFISAAAMVRFHSTHKWKKISVYDIYFFTFKCTTIQTIATTWQPLKFAWISAS